MSTREGGVDEKAFTLSCLVWAISIAMLETASAETVNAEIILQPPVVSPRNQITVLETLFNPLDTDLHTCREVPYGGPPSVKVHMCLILKGGVIAMPGDIVAVATNNTNLDLEVLLNCKSTYTSAMEFKPTTMPGWGDMGLHLTPAKPSGFIGIGSVTRADRISWSYGGSDICRWTVR